MTTLTLTDRIRRSNRRTARTTAVEVAVTTYHPQRRRYVEVDAWAMQNVATDSLAVDACEYIGEGYWSARVVASGVTVEFHSLDIVSDPSHQCER